MASAFFSKHGVVAHSEKIYINIPFASFVLYFSLIRLMENSYAEFVKIFLMS
jgi:hypothetical protein